MSFKLSISAEEQLRRQRKIINTLIDRVENSDGIHNSHFGIFQSAITLQNEVQTKSERLDDALKALGSTSDQLKAAYSERVSAEQNLSDALEMMQEGFALFQEDKLIVSNNNFQSIFPDISHILRNGIEFSEYVQAVARSKRIQHDDAEFDIKEWNNLASRLKSQPYVSLILPLINQRWVQVSLRRTQSGNIAILQSDISDILRQSHREKYELIDQQAEYLQGTFDNLSIGVASFSEDWCLQLNNRIFGDLLMLPRTLLIKGTSIEKLLFHLQDHVIASYAQFGREGRTIAQFDDLLQGAIIAKTRNESILEFNFQEHPKGGFIANVQDVTITARARDSLSKMNEELEKRVVQRTQELHDANSQLKEQFENLMRIQAELQSATHLAEQANISKTRFLAAASHDLLQPVNAAKLYISMIRARTTDDKSLTHIERLERAYQNMENLLHDLLDISKLEGTSAKFNIRNIELQNFLKNLVDDQIETARAKGIEIRMRSPRAFIASDEHYLGRILQNLIANAIQYTPMGGKILVGARMRGNFAQISVYDTGIGIADENKTLIFKEFTRIEPEKHQGVGVGLGLSIVERASRQLQHAVSFDSTIEQGSVFRIDVPLSGTAPEKPEIKFKNENISPELFECLVLFIENDPEVLDATSALLESWGAHVIAVRSKAEAMEQLEEIGEQPHLIIADYQLDNDETGIEAIKAVRQKVGKILPAIMLTANHNEALVQSAELLDFKVLRKPIRLNELRREWEKALSGKAKNRFNIS